MASNEIPAFAVVTSEEDAEYEYVQERDAFYASLEKEPERIYVFRPVLVHADSIYAR